MTDFLTRLAQRTLGLIPIVQPWIDSQYAPATESVMATTLQPFAMTQAATAAPDVSISQATPQTVRLPDPELPLTRDASLASLISSAPLSLAIPNFNIEARSISLVDQPESALPSSQGSPRIDPEQPPPASQSISASPTNPSVNAVESFPSPAKQPLGNQVFSPIVQARQRVEPQQLGASARLEEPFPPQHPPLPQTALPSQSPSINLPLTPLMSHSSSFPLVDVQKVRVDYPLVAPTGRITSELTTSQSSLAHLSSSEALPLGQPEPIIEVRIGRIEVRATQPETSRSRPKSTPSTPALSLNDYLTQRDGG